MKQSEEQKERKNQGEIEVNLDIKSAQKSIPWCKLVFPITPGVIISEL